MIEAAHDTWLRQQDRYRRQRASLELGWLTEEVLPVKDLQKLINYAKRQDLRPLPNEWYYANVKVSPLWKSKSWLVFRAQLPFTDNQKYLRYHIQTWPVMGNSSEFRVRLQIPAEVTIQSETGGLFEPQECQGERPVVCRTGPIYDRTRFQCARGVLTGEVALRKTCRVTISRADAAARSTVYEILPGTVIISTLGESYSLHCRGQVETRVTLSGGLYVIQLDYGCNLVGDGWSISNIVLKSATAFVRLQIIDVIPLDLPTIVPSEAIAQHLDTPHWQALGEVKDISLTGLKDMIIDDDIAGGSGMGQVSWATLLILLAMFVILTGVTVMILCYQKGMIHLPMRRNKAQSVCEDWGDELHALTQPPTSAKEAGLPADKGAVQPADAGTKGGAWSGERPTQQEDLEGVSAVEVTPTSMTYQLYGPH